MAEIANTSVFSQTDASNNSGTVPTWAEGQAPSQVNDSARALQGAVTREWNWRSFTLTAGGTADAKTLTYSVAPAAYYTGQIFSFIANTTNTGSATININGLGAKTIKKDVSGTMTALAASDMVSGMRVMLAYDGTDMIWVNKGGSVSTSSTTEVLTGTDSAKAVTPDALAALWEAGSNITDGATITIGEGGYFNLITSTTAITAFTVTTDKAGRSFRVRFDTARTLTHNATSLILPTAANITTVQGDIAQFRSLGGGNVVCEWYTRADGTSLAGGSAATQAEMETASDTTKFVTPGRQHFHPGHPKVWMSATGAGVLSESYNMTSVTDTGTGDLDGTIATDFSTATWALLASIISGSLDTTANTYINKVININAQAAGTFGLQSGEWRIDNNSLSNQLVALVDPTSYHMTGFGDHA